MIVSIAHEKPESGRYRIQDWVRFTDPKTGTVIEGPRKSVEVMAKAFEGNHEK